MSRYDGLIIPRSYSDYINKTDAATLSQALQLPGVMDAAPTENSNHPAKSGGIFTSLSTCQKNTVNTAIETGGDIVYYKINITDYKPIMLTTRGGECIIITSDNTDGIINAVRIVNVYTKIIGLKRGQNGELYVKINVWATIINVQTLTVTTHQYTIQQIDETEYNTGTEIPIKEIT